MVIERSVCVQLRRMVLNSGLGVTLSVWREKVSNSGLGVTLSVWREKDLNSGLGVTLSVWREKDLNSGLGVTLSVYVEKRERFECGSWLEKREASHYNKPPTSGITHMI
jgi:CRISPR/Cas system CMR-associated protein Cmr5 small subunit